LRLVGRVGPGLAALVSELARLAGTNSNRALAVGLDARREGYVGQEIPRPGLD